MPLLFSQTVSWLSDLKAGEVCQKQAEAVPEKPATSRLFNALSTSKTHWYLLGQVGTLRLSPLLRKNSILKRAPQLIAA